MKTIPVHGGKVALVDDADHDRLSKIKWYVWKGHRTVYAMGYVGSVNGKTQQCFMHRMILDASAPQTYVDHRDGDGLNNQRTNLRLCSNSQNQANRPNWRKRSGATSIYRGVSFAKDASKAPKNRRWKSAIMVNRKNRYLGYFATEEEAARAYNEAATQHFGEFATLNPVPNAKAVA